MPPMETEFRGLRLIADVTGKTNLSEADIASHTAATSCDWGYLFQKALLQEEDVPGLRVLDVGAGASDFTARLLELGADAYAVDPKFASMSTLKSWVQKGNSFYKDNNFRDEYQVLTRALERFKLSSAVHKERYKASLATKMPFPDNYFDIVFSGFTLFGYLDLDIDILTQAALECLRVTKPNGTIRLFPFKGAIELEPDKQINILRIKNNVQLLKKLQVHEGVQSALSVPIPYSKVPAETLVIRKRGPSQSDTIESTATAPLA